ncbi:EcsC family protein [Ornithinimicrobium sufpigmenti]|uniref:EcsC family protein n=1 Tax=Ornithinimicrobium sufpigmenti TaxID=2508882 RepID=UPI0010362CC9|nr:MULTISPECIES: EcsC family protein [unclassified Ornithinimicrobium]
MGLFGSNKPARRDDSRAVVEEDPGPIDAAANAFVGKLLDLGIDGIGPVDSVDEVVAKLRRKHGEDGKGVEAAIKEVVSDHVKKAGVGGFLTGAGGVVTMPVSLPANVLEFYVLATRMVASIATLRGYDVTTKGARSAVLLSLVGADADDLLRKAGLGTVSGMTGSGRLAAMASNRMPRAAAMMINKAVGFRLLTQVGGRALTRFVRYVPVAGGIVGAGLDGLLMKRIADHARSEFTTEALTGAVLEADGHTR